MENKEKLLDILKNLCTIQNEISEYFGEFEQLGEPISELSEIIIKEYGKSLDDDLIFEQLMNFGDGDISKNKLLSKYLK